MPNLFGFFRPKIEYRVVEVAAPRTVGEFNKDAASAIATLQGHPGFQYLLQKLRWQNAALVSAIKTRRQGSVRDFEFLQSGIAWTGWLEEQLQRAIGYREQVEVPAEAPYESERQAFEDIQKFIEVLK